MTWTSSGEPSLYQFLSSHQALLSTSNSRKGAVTTRWKIAHDKSTATLRGLCRGYGAPIVRSSARYGAIKKSDLRGRTSVQKPVLHLWSNTSSLFAFFIHLRFWVSANDNLAAEITKGTNGGSRWWLLKKQIFTFCTYSSRGRKNRLSFSWYLGCLWSTGSTWEAKTHTTVKAEGFWNTQNKMHVLLSQNHAQCSVCSGTVEVVGHFKAVE